MATTVQVRTQCTTFSLNDHISRAPPLDICLQWCRYSGGERAADIADKIAAIRNSRPNPRSVQDRASMSGAAVEASMKHAAIREILTLTRHHESTEIDTMFDPLAGAFTHPLDEFEGTDLPSPTIADM